MGTGSALFDSSVYQWVVVLESPGSGNSSDAQVNATSLTLYKESYKNASSEDELSTVGKGTADRSDSGFLASWSHWQGCNPNRKERCLELETMASEISLSFSILRRSTLGPNVQLQEVARKTLWALENDNKEMLLLFKGLFFGGVDEMVLCHLRGFSV
ncbi:SH3 domain and tetratricopeptide repeat-containing 2 isoform X2 [Pelobates cultripes]|uniref:SH3 domain and tetratricopeptide repeat-containing 2 isoform X2 n=1 Tax=Pelobates cultripes TaxID=61616 RepID=A0AAD1VXJ4_PELCU|nr:SH3 domain and tetratricopeptide repeat-containing 2 isoform X2 [Pelobates cultripes]